MKSKSLQSIIDHQSLQIYTPSQQQHSSTKHRIYHLSDEKINDIIFIEETPKIKVLNNNNNNNKKFAKNFKYLFHR
jgi:hypothetical protein